MSGIVQITRISREAQGIPRCLHIPSLWRSATTHTDLELRALDLGIPVKTIHNASIMNAVGAAGLQLYRYGETISIVFFTGVVESGNKGSGWVGREEVLVEPCAWVVVASLEL